MKKRPDGSTTRRSLRRAAEDRLARRSAPVPRNVPDTVKAMHELRVHEIELEMQNEELEVARAETQAALARFTHLYDFAPVGYFTLERDGTIQQTNLAGASLFAQTRSRLMYRRFAHYIEEAAMPDFADFLSKVFAGRVRQVCEVTLRPTAKRGAVIAHIEAIGDENGQECRLIVTDITERKHVEARLQLAASVFTHAHEGIMIMDADGSIIEVNRSFSNITGYDRDEVIGKNARMLGSGCQEPDFYAKKWRDLEARGHWYGEIWDRRKNGEIYVAMLQVTAVRDALGKLQHYVALMSDITAIKEHQNRLEHLAHYDALTGLPNRVLLADRLQHAMVQIRRREGLMALVYLDLDGFKAVNDTHGHEIGDELLIQVSQRLKEALREGDTLARLGGDEFVAVLADLSSPAECEIILSRLLVAAAAPVHSRGLVLTVSASIGVALSPQDGSDAELLLRHADQAMYQAKQAGRNRYHLFDPERDTHGKAHRESLQRITLGLDRGEFVLHFEPKVNMRTGAVVGAEALIRWRHPERGLLMPDDFLAAAENDEVICRLGDWVLDAALDQMAVWRRGGLSLSVSVNIAAYHLQQDNFLSSLREKLGAHPDIHPDRLELEVTETAALADIKRTSKVIAGCQGLGVRFSLDDFGTGYSSLTYLRLLPAAALKIDRSFVRNMLWDKEDMAIVEGVIGLALAFDREVVAEGVETPDHAKLLLRVGCDLAQGSVISSPLPPQAVPGWVSQWRPEPQWATFLDTPLNRDNLPLVYAEVDHRQLVRQLENLLAERMDTLPQIDAMQCQLGAWILQEGRIEFAHLPEFRTLVKLHERLHALAQEMLLAQSAGAGDRTLPRLDKLRVVRDDFIDHLHLLAAAIGRSVANKAVRGNTAKEKG